MRNQESALNSNQLEQFPVIRVTITASIIPTLTDEKYFLNWKLGQAKFKTAICLLTCRSTSIPLISLIIVKAIFSSLIIGPHTWPARVGIVWTDPSHNKYGRLLAYYHHWANTIIRNSPLIDPSSGARVHGPGRVDVCRVLTCDTIQRYYNCSRTLPEMEARLTW